MSYFFVTFALQRTIWCLSKVVMHRTANPFTAVRIRQAPLYGRVSNFTLETLFTS